MFIGLDFKYYQKYCQVEPEITWKEFVVKSWMYLEREWQGLTESI